MDLPSAGYYRPDVKSNGSIQYALLQAPVRVDRSLRPKSKQAGLSLNETAIDALSKVSMGPCD